MQKQQIIIFLDLNGVMFPKNGLFSAIKPFMNLRKLLDTYPQIKLVITSSLRLGTNEWRLQDALEEFYKVFKQSIIGETIEIKGLCYYRNVYLNKIVERTIESKSFRGLEINQWLIDNKDKLQCKISKLEYYIIDDNEHLNWLAKQANKLIICDKNKGFDDKMFKILIDKIKSNEQKKKEKVNPS